VIIVKAYCAQCGAELLLGRPVRVAGDYSVNVRYSKHVCPPEKKGEIHVSEKR
jgi:hypothetical protein